MPPVISRHVARNFLREEEATLKIFLVIHLVRKFALLNMRKNLDDKCRSGSCFSVSYKLDYKLFRRNQF